MTESSRQDALQLSPSDHGALFSRNFLETRLRDWTEYEALECADLLLAIRQLWEEEREALRTANEAQVEEHFVQPILNLLGHAWTPQAGYSTPAGRSVPDYALFLNDDARRKVTDLPKGDLGRFSDAVALAEAKEFGRPFDTRRGGPRNEDPHAQILRYLNETRVRWGILTNGRVWRLYSYERATQGQFYEVDLIALLDQGDATQFKRFATFFMRRALEPNEHGACMLDRMLRDAERNAVAVGDALERQVFGAIPLLATGLIGGEERSEQNLAAAFENSLVFLYRMLFCLHAEARALLPRDNPHYSPQSLMRLRAEVAEQRDRGVAYSERSDRLYSFLRALFRIVDEGEPAFGVNAYNGGLFSPDQHPDFEGRTIPDPELAPAIDLLSRVSRDFVDFQDLAVRHLGTIYEKLLAYRLAEAGGKLVLEESPLKHRSGSYFTPERIVDAIVEKTLDPVLRSVSTEISDRGLRGRAALERFLKIKVCDPAVGSGHFLVAAVEYIATFIATDPAYGEAEGEEPIETRELRRLVAERCIYGVDINPMAVELARLSLWLATVDRNQPLTFLENLRVGNSIVGTSVTDLLAGGESVFSAALARQAEDLLARRAEIAARPSTTTKAVREKKQIVAAAEDLRRPIEAFADETLGVTLDDPEIGDPFHWEVEFPEVFLTASGEPRDDCGFDAIVGNPPYIQIQSLGRATAEYCRGRYETAAGAFDVYIVFIERGLELLGPAGRLGFIVPNKLTKLDMSEGLRRQLVERKLAEEILDFGGAQLFGATNYTAILILDATGDRTTLSYRKLLVTEGDPIAEIEEMEPSKFRLSELGGGPWILATPSERRLMDRASDGASRLEEVTSHIFQGLITSADHVFHFEDLGFAGPLRRVRSKASGGVIVLEPDLLHPLASGTDVGTHAFAPLRTLLLFPYGPTGGDQMRLLSWGDIEIRPRTAAYLRKHEPALRSRERGKMDHEGWYGYVYPKNLAAHELPKLGVPRLCERLRASADAVGGTYFDNVDVNGIVPSRDGPSVWALVTLLNSRLLDFVFRLRTVPFRGNYMSANKQFIAPLPINLGHGHEDHMETLGRQLHSVAEQTGVEQKAFLDWLGDRIGADPRSLPGKRTLVAYEAYSTGDLLERLRKTAKRLKVDPTGRAFRDQLEREHSESVGKLRTLRRESADLQTRADEVVYDAYGITDADRDLVATLHSTQPAHVL